MNHLEPNLRTVRSFIGMNDVSFVRIGYDEFRDDRFRHPLAAAEAAVDRLATAVADAQPCKPALRWAGLRRPHQRDQPQLGVLVARAALVHVR